MNLEVIARELVGVARILAYEELSSDDRRVLDKAMEKAVEDLVMGLKVSAEVEFDWRRTGGRDTPTEFEIRNEKAYTTPRTNVLLIGRIKRYVLTELLKNRQKLDESPEAIVESSEFIESLQDVIRGFNWNMEDVDCSIPRGSTYCKLVMIPRLSGQVLRIDYQMTDGEMERVLERVREDESVYQDE